MELTAGSALYAEVTALLEQGVLTAKHPVFATLQAAHEAGDDEKVRTYAGLLFDQALLVEGILPDNPLAFAQAVAELMK